MIRTLEERNKLVEENTGLAGRVAKQYLGRGLDFDDLFQHGCLGLIRAAEEYDPEVGRFSTYADYWIKLAIRMAIKNESTMIRVPVHVWTNRAKLNKAWAALGLEASADECAARSGLSKKQLELDCQLRVAMSMELESNIEFGEEGCFVSVADYRSDPDKVDDRWDDLYDLLATLPARDREIVVMRFGLDGRDPMTLSAIGATFGCTKEWTRQIVNSVTSRLRRIMNAGDDGVQPARSPGDALRRRPGCREDQGCPGRRGGRRRKHAV